MTNTISSSKPNSKVKMPTINIALMVKPDLVKSSNDWIKPSVRTERYDSSSDRERREQSVIHPNINSEPIFAFGSPLILKEKTFSLGRFSAPYCTCD